MRLFLRGSPDEVCNAGTHTQQTRDASYYATRSEISPEARRLGLQVLTETFPLLHPNAVDASVTKLRRSL